jgi:hypothetical protein
MAVNGPSAASLLRWTYAGALDDMVVWYPWPKISISRDSLNERLAHSVVVGAPLLLNDGYLLLNRACLESLGFNSSPLRVLLNEGYVRVLSRTASQSFEDLVLQGAKKGIPSYARLLKDKKKLSGVLKVVGPLEASLRSKGGFVGWPRYDLTNTYVALIRCLMSRRHEERGVPDIPERVFDAVATEFLRRMSNEPHAPRSEWERVAQNEARSDRQIHLLMQLANEVYHLNFGIGISAAAPADLPPNREIAVQTRMPDGLSNFYKTHQPRVDPDSLPRPPTLPGGVDYSNGNILMAFFNTSQSVGAARQTYLAAHASFLDGRLPGAAMVKASQEYQGQINEYLLTFAPRGKRTLKAVNAAVAVSTVLVGIQLPGALPAAVIAAVAFYGTEFLAPTVMERWRAAGKLDALINLRWSKAVDERRVLAAMAIDDKEASKLVADAAQK